MDVPGMERASVWWLVDYGVGYIDLGIVPHSFGGCWADPW